MLVKSYSYDKKPKFMGKSYHILLKVIDMVKSFSYVKKLVNSYGKKVRVMVKNLKYIYIYIYIFLA